jgi:hypothetical protein
MDTFREFQWSSLLLGYYARPSRNFDWALACLMGKAILPEAALLNPGQRANDAQTELDALEGARFRSSSSGSLAACSAYHY